jgi:hypothetical protein
VLAFPEWRAIVEAPDSEGEILLDAGCSLRALVEAVATGANAVLDRHGETGYREKWGEPAFPLASLDELRSSQPAS